MKQNFLLKTMLLLCALVVGGSSAWADDETVTFPTSTSNATLTLPYKVDGTTDVTVTINSNSGTSPATNTDGLRVYAGSTIQFSSSSEKIESIVFTYKRNKKQTNGVTANTGYFMTEFSVGNSTASNLSATWEADDENTSSVTFTLGTGSGNYALQSALVTYVGGNAPTTYQVYFDAGAGTFVGNTDFPDEDNEVTAGTYTLPSATPPDGYTFDGWVPNGGTDPITGSYEVSDDVYFEAQYTNPTAPACTIDPSSYDFGTVAIGTPVSKTFTVTTANLEGDVTLFVFTGDKDEFAISPATIPQNATSTEVTVTFTPTSAKDFSIVLRANGGGFYDHDLAEVSGEGAEAYTVTFDPGNGTCATATMDGFDGAEIDLPTATPTATCVEAGWTFAGWATASVASGSTTATLVPSKYTVTENITLYAVYQLTDDNGATTTFNFGDIAETTEGWINGTAHTTVEISPITLTANGGGNNGKFYVSDATWRMYNGGSVSITSTAGAITSVTSNPSTTFTIANGSASQSFTATTMFKSITVNYETATFASSPVAAVATPVISGTTPYYDQTEVTLTCGTAGATIYYRTYEETWTEYTGPFSIYNSYNVQAKATKTGWEDSEVAEKTFTQIHPLSVTEALEAINALDNGGEIAEQYVKGYVSTTGSVSSGAITYKISADGNAANELTVYKGKGLNNADFTAATDIALGDEVVVYGTLQKYYASSTTTPEFIAGNYLFNKVRHPAPEFTLDPTSKSLDAYSHETVDVTLTTNTDGTLTCESSDEDVATVAQKSAGVYTITAQTEGTATITIKSAVSANYAPASATVAITVTDNRTDAGISFANDAEETTWGESYTVQALTNTNGVDVVWSSTDGEVAVINGDGTGLTLNKAGTTTIKATFAGNATYKAAVASYTLTINKADAGLSYDVTSFDIMLNDDSFVAPTLNNPHGQVVTYASSNTAIATVNANTGEIETLVTTAEGSATITATLEANIWYNGGTANYTINVIDPDKKGGKYNPYTVAEVNSGSYSGVNYVKGYIVGCFTSKETNAASSGNTNLALSDTPDEKSGANTIAVQLPSGAIRNAWNIDDNNVIGMEILVKGNITGYFTNKTGVKSPSEITAVSVPATISAAEYATFSNAYALDFSKTGITVYTAIDNETSVTLNEVTSGKVPANTPVVLYKAGADGSAIDVPVIATADAIAGTNDLRVSTGVDVENMYVLAKKPTIGFYPWTGTNLSAGKIYLQGKASYGAREFLGFSNGNTTGVENIEHGTLNMEHSVYDLQGRRVSQPTRGMYIVNGKKVIIK